MSANEPSQLGGGGVSDGLTYVGHATVLVRLAGARILTDPVLRPRILGFIRRHAPSPGADVAAEIDAVLISHLHPDHLDHPSLREIGRDVPVVVPTGGGRALRWRGFREVIELEPGEATRVGPVTVRATRAVHDGRRYKIGRRVEALGYELQTADRRIYFAGDTDLFPEMRDLAGGLDVALLPISGWGPEMRRGHLDPRQAAQAAAILAPRIAVPIHWGTLLRAGLARRRPELLSEPPREFAAHVAKLAPGVEARPLDPGESLTLAARAAG